MRTSRLKYQGCLIIWAFVYPRQHFVIYFVKAFAQVYFFTNVSHHTDYHVRNCLRFRDVHVPDYHYGSSTKGTFTVISCLTTVLQILCSLRLESDSSWKYFADSTRFRNFIQAKNCNFWLIFQGKQEKKKYMVDLTVCTVCNCMHKQSLLSCVTAFFQINTVLTLEKLEFNQFCIQSFSTIKINRQVLFFFI